MRQHSRGLDILVGFMIGMVFAVALAYVLEGLGWNNPIASSHVVSTATATPTVAPTATSAAPLSSDLGCNSIGCTHIGTTPIPTKNVEFYAAVSNGVLVRIPEADSMYLGSWYFLRDLKDGFFEVQGDGNLLPVEYMRYYQIYENNRLIAYANHTGEILIQMKEKDGATYVFMNGGPYHKAFYEDHIGVFDYDVSGLLGININLRDENIYVPFP
ncbi:hypothetical protein HGB07_08290 [Candidatus Roizmanbacteria bacterium]|nr:hypothetical protein [Candidatus Roizmanbacteria bacterium]